MTFPFIYCTVQIMKITLYRTDLLIPHSGVPADLKLEHFHLGKEQALSAQSIDFQDTDGKIHTIKSESGRSMRFRTDGAIGVFLYDGQPTAALINPPHFCFPSPMCDWYADLYLQNRKSLKFGMAHFIDSPTSEDVMKFFEG